MCDGAGGGLPDSAAPSSKGVSSLAMLGHPGARAGARAPTVDARMLVLRAATPYTNALCLDAIVDVLTNFYD